MDCNARKTNNKQTNKHIYRYKRNFITDTTLDVISLAFTYTFVISKKMFQIKVSCPHGVNIYVLYIFFLRATVLTNFNSVLLTRNSFICPSSFTSSYPKNLTLWRQKEVSKKHKFRKTRKSWERRHTLCEGEDGGERTLLYSQASPTRPSERNNTEIKMWQWWKVVAWNKGRKMFILCLILK